jgi:hypothetical protein
VDRPATGRIRLPESEQIMFVAERPYLPPGTLREALLRTGREIDPPDERILEVLASLGLAPVIERVGGLDVERDWDDLLALGEQQRVVIARLVLAEPRFGVLHRHRHHALARSRSRARCDSSPAASITGGRVRRRSGARRALRCGARAARRWQLALRAFRCASGSPSTAATSRVGRPPAEAYPPRR